MSPLATHPSVDTWTEVPFAPGVVLVGDSAGYNDPIIGQGLSLAMADVRDVVRLIGAQGTGADFTGLRRRPASTVTPSSGWRPRRWPS